MESPSAEYVAIALFEGTSDAADDEPLYEECIYLVEAKTTEEAREKVRTSVEAPCSYENEYGQQITWSFMTIVDVSEVLDGESAEVRGLYARHFRDYDAYQRFEPLLGGTIDRRQDEDN